MTVHRWKPIEDLPQNWSVLASTELKSLAAIWGEQSVRLQQSDALKQFNDRLHREWAIETGIIENLYSIDRGTAQMLIQQGIEASLIPHGSTDKPAEEIVPILKDQEEVLEGLLDFVAQQRVLSTSFIKQLHQVLTRHQETVQVVNGLGRTAQIQLLRGEWKKSPNNPKRPDGEVHEYCPPEHVAAEMDCLIATHQDHQKMDVPPEIEAAWMHHRFSQIHPFQDGNGRIARALASLIFLQYRWFPLVIHRELRADYIHALEKADEGNLQPLIQLFATIQKKSFVKALSISENVLHDRDPVQQVITAATDKLKKRQETKFQERKKAFDLSKHLETLAKNRLDEVAHELNHELSQLSSDYSATTDQSIEDKTDFWFRKQIIEIAKRLV